MKKLLISMLLFTNLILIGCSGKNPLDPINVIVPNGSTSIAQAYLEYSLQSSKDYTYNVFRVAGPEPLIAAFVNQEYDFIIAPITLGAKLINTGADYSFLATITEGNLFLASGNPIESIESLSGKNIIAFGQNNTPDIVLRSILSAVDFEIEPTVTYVGNTQATMAELTRDPNNIVLISEPFISMASNILDTLHLLDLNPVWQEVLDLPSFPQAGLFVKNGVSEDLIDHYMQLLEESIVFANNNSSDLSSYTTALDYPFPADVVESSIARSGLVFKSAVESRENIEAYFNAILEYNAELIHSKLPEDSFYYNKG